MIWATVNLNQVYLWLRCITFRLWVASNKTNHCSIISRDPGSAQPSFDASWRDEHDGTLGVVIWATVNLNMSSTSLLLHFSGCNFSERSASIGNHATEMKLSTSSTTLAEKLIFTKGLLLVSNRVFAPIQKLWKAGPWPRGLWGTSDGISFAYSLTCLREQLPVRSAKSGNVGPSLFLDRRRPGNRVFAFLGVRRRCLPAFEIDEIKTLLFLIRWREQGEPVSSYFTVAEQEELGDRKPVRTLSFSEIQVQHSPHSTRLDKTNTLVPLV